VISWRCNAIHVILNLVLSIVKGAMKNLIHESATHPNPVNPVNPVEKLVNPQIW
jgi:hypothetical protein